MAKLKPYERGKRIRFQPNDRLLLPRRSERPGYAEWNGAAVHAIDARERDNGIPNPFGIVRWAALTRYAECGIAL
ncbi:hypothetical protein Q3C01_23635 [Bradyrhizobium sp. UFLA05-109]